MTQITGVGFSNFRVFEKETFFDLAPISIFTGTNSSGKSSVFKGLKLLNNNAKDSGYLNFSGEGHKLGTFDLAKSRNSKSNIIQLSLEISKKYLLTIDYLKVEEGGYWNQILVSLRPELKKESLKSNELLKITHVPDEPLFKSYLNYNYFLEQLLEESRTNIKSHELSDLKEFSKNRQTKLKEWTGNLVDPQKIITIIPSLNYEEANSLASILDHELLRKISINFIDVLTDGFWSTDPQDKGIFEILEDVKNGRDYSEFVLRQLLEGSNIDNGILYQLGESKLIEIVDIEILKYAQIDGEIFLDKIVYCLKTLGEIHYLDSIRANSQRLYSNQSQGTHFNEILLGLNNIWSKTEKREKNGTLAFADKWLKKFGIGDKVVINRIKGIATEVLIEKDGNLVDLIDLGFGVTQFLPILLFVSSVLNNKPVPISYFFDEEDDPNYHPVRIEGPLLLIEEPESNLHPKLQSLLADFFIDVAKTFEVTLLIETHSEYLIRRLQVLTASGEAKPEDSVIYYLNGEKRAEGEEQVTKININPDGSLTNDFGPGFIDEATNWKLELMRLKNAKLHQVNLN